MQRPILYWIENVIGLNKYYLKLEIETIGNKQSLIDNWSHIDNNIVLQNLINLWGITIFILLLIYHVYTPGIIIT
jgi:hypothetical protein